MTICISELFLHYTSLVSMAKKRYIFLHKFQDQSKRSKNLNTIIKPL